MSPRVRARAIVLERQLTERFANSFVARLAEPVLLRRYLTKPHEVDIEVTSSCDADCIMCPRKAMRRRMGPMDFGLFTKIVDEAVALGVRELCLNGYGEFSTLKNYREHLAYIRRRSRSVKIVLNTNGMRMTEDLARAYVEFAVDVVNVTIDGATAETYERIRKHLRLADVEENVLRLLRLRNEARRRRPHVMVHMIAMPQNVHEVHAFLAKWKGVADHVGIGGLVSRIGSIDLGGGAASPSRWQDTPCFLLWRQMPILSDGTVALCCDDWDGQGAVGNVREQSIADVWQSVARARLRSLHRAGRGDEIAECRDCQQPRRGPWWFNAPAGSPR